MGTLIDPDDLLSIADRLASCWADGKAIMGTSSGNPVRGTLRGTLSDLLGFILTLDVYEQETDLLTDSKTILDDSPAESELFFLNTMLSSLDGHASNQGSTIDSTITSLKTFLDYYASASPFTYLVTPEFDDLYFSMRATHLSASTIMSPGIHPYVSSTLYPLGMGTADVTAGHVPGVDVDTTHYSPVVPLIEVAADFGGGSAAPTLTIDGTDDQGNAAVWGPVTITGGNNPAAALSGITITPPTTAYERQVVAFSSVTGIVQGSVLKINSGLVDEEVIIVEDVTGSNVTAVFRKAHAAGATVTGFTSTVVGDPDTGAGRRLRSITNLTLGLSSHSSGTVRVTGIRDRDNV